MKLVKTVVLIFIFGAISSFAAFSALAYSYSQSSNLYFSNNGYYYYNYAMITVDSDYATGNSAIDVQGSGTVPTGYIGAQGRLYSSSGTLMQVGSTYYNSVAASGLSSGTGRCYSTGTFYSKGITYAYNGNGYTTYWTNQSPNLSN